EVTSEILLVIEAAALHGCRFFGWMFWGYRRMSTTAAWVGWFGNLAKTPLVSVAVFRMVWQRKALKVQACGTSVAPAILSMT
ncbi:MAG: hypothetical protein WBW00_18810, partial [Pseudolabrys sp.]